MEPQRYRGVVNIFDIYYPFSEMNQKIQAFFACISLEWSRKSDLN